MRGIFVLALFGALLAGCGDKSKSEHKKFVDRADAICQAYGQAFRQIPQPPDPTAPVQVAPYLQRFVPLLKAENDRLGRLVPPAKDESNMRLFLAVQGAQATFAERARAAAARGKQAQMQSELARWQATIGQANQVGRRLGFSVCAGVVGTTTTGQ